MPKKQLKEKLADIEKEMFQIRPLTSKEKGKSLDFWEGFSQARTEDFLIIKKYLTK